MTAVKDLVILLPGITGSVLANAEGNDIWAPNFGATWRGIFSGGTSLTSLELAPGAPDDGVRATRLVPDATLVPGLVKIDGYTQTQKELATRLGLEPGTGFVGFPYDWRRDNAENATLFKAFTAEKLHAWRKGAGGPDARLVLVGHSMGGLVARYFVECLEGWRDTRLLLTLGTPHRGSLKALDFLVNGMKKGIGPFGVDLSPLLRSCPSVYQLLPIYPCVRHGGQSLRVAQAAQAGLLPHVDPARVLSAQAFHQRIRDAQQANAQDDGYRANGYRLVPVVGIDQPTAQSLQVDAGGCKLLDMLDGDDEMGDGTVPRASATPIDLQAKPAEVYASEMHGALQNNDGVLANVRGILTRENIDWSKYLRADDRTPITLDLDDVVLPGQPLVVRARPHEGQPRLTIRCTSMSAGIDFSEDLLRDGDTGWQHNLFAVPPGVWRVTVQGEGVAPVTDLVVVAFP